MSIETEMDMESFFLLFYHGYPRMNGMVLHVSCFAAVSFNPLMVLSASLVSCGLQSAIYAIRYSIE